MVKGNLDGIDPGSFAPQVDGRTGWFDLKQLASDFEILKTILKGRRTILVGHNMFLDLIYFYKCFFGALPAKVEDFQKEIHALFPMIIDTKYMATSLVESLDNGSSALEELHGNMMSLDSPRLGKLLFIW